MRKFDPVFVVVTILAILGLLYVIVYGGYQNELTRDVCVQQEGVWMSYDRKCIKKEVFINVHSPAKKL